MAEKNRRCSACYWPPLPVVKLCRDVKIVMSFMTSLTGSCVEATMAHRYGAAVIS